MADAAEGDSYGRLMLLFDPVPAHVENILSGIKTVELRLPEPAVAPGQPVAIYATTPSAAVVATCRIERVEVSTCHPACGPPAGLARHQQDRVRSLLRGHVGGRSTPCF